jgi:hypothetical protein
MKKSFELLPPMMPNFISYKIPPRPRQEGFNADGNKLPIEELSKDEAEEYGELMKQTFIQHWQSKTTTP